MCDKAKSEKRAVRREQWRGGMEPGRSYTVIELAEMAGFTYYDVCALAVSLGGGSRVFGQVEGCRKLFFKLMFADFPFKGIQANIPGSGKKALVEWLETEHSKLNIPPFAGAVGEGDMEAAEEARAMDGYEAYSNYLKDEGHIVPDWHQVPEDLQLAFVEFACRVAERKGSQS